MATDAGCARAAQQRLNHAQHGDGDNRADEVLEHVEVDRAEVQAVVQHQAFRDVPHLRQRIETRDFGHDGRQNNRQQRPRHLRVQLLRPEDHEQHNQQTDGDRLPVGGKSDAGVAPQLFQCACADGVRAEEVVHLPQGDDNRDAAGEAHDDAGRDEVDELAEAEDARQQDNHARRKRRDEHALQAVLGDDADEDGAHGPGRTADLEGRAAKQPDDKSADDGGDKPRGGVRAGGHAECEGKRQRHRRHCDAAQDVLEEFAGVVAGEFVFQVGNVLFEHFLLSLLPLSLQQC